MTRVFRIHETGGPEVLRLQTSDIGEPGPTQVRLQHTAIGVNFIDVYYRRGTVATNLPSGLGFEAAGVVEAVGNLVTSVRPGDRVAYATGPAGAYAEARIVDAGHLIPLPDNISDEIAATNLLRGMTVEYLLHRTARVEGGQTVLFHAASSGVGLLFCQWARKLGITVIGTVSSQEKAELALRHGCTHVLDGSEPDLSRRVLALTNGEKLPFVYDSVGRDTFRASLDCLAPRGLLVLFGQTSGVVDPVDLRILTEKGSLYLTRPTLRDYAATPGELAAMAGHLFLMIESGALQPTRAVPYRFTDAAQAHHDIEMRKIKGVPVLKVAS